MKLVVISDSHGRVDKIRSVLSMHPDRDAMIFLGDCLRDLDGIDDLSGLVAVRGNCDGFSFSSMLYNAPEELMMSFDGFSVLMMHGHTRSVKSGVEEAVACACDKGADILLYGHTHVKKEKYFPEGTVVGGQMLKKPLWIFNPGSLGQSSFGIVEIKKGSVLFSHGAV